jgi:hypothetical protein
MMSRTALALLILSSTLAVAAEVKITPAEREEEARWLRSLGVKPPASGWPRDGDKPAKWTLFTAAPSEPASFLVPGDP